MKIVNVPTEASKEFAEYAARVNAGDMESEFIFNGTPAQFGFVVGRFGDKTAIYEPVQNTCGATRVVTRFYYVWHGQFEYSEIPPSANIVRAGISPADAEHPLEGHSLTAELLPGGKSLVTLSESPYPCQELSELWESLRAEMIRQGWIDAALPDAPALPPSGAGDGPADPGEKREPAKPQPWESIPDNGWDRSAVQLLWKGYSDPDIANRVDKDIVPKTVTNRLSDLRGQYPELVPTREKLKQMSRDKLS